MVGVSQGRGWRCRGLDKAETLTGQDTLPRPRAGQSVYTLKAPLSFLIKIDAFFMRSFVKVTTDINLH